MVWVCVLIGVGLCHTLCGFVSLMVLVCVMNSVDMVWVCFLIVGGLCST